MKKAKNIKKVLASLALAGIFFSTNLHAMQEEAQPSASCVSSGYEDEQLNILMRQIFDEIKTQKHAEIRIDSDFSSFQEYRGLENLSTIERQSIFYVIRKKILSKELFLTSGNISNIIKKLFNDVPSQKIAYDELIRIAFPQVQTAQPVEQVAENVEIEEVSSPTNPVSDLIDQLEAEKELPEGTVLSQIQTNSDYTKLILKELIDQLNHDMIAITPKELEQFSGNTTEVLKTILAELGNAKYDLETKKALTFLIENLDKIDKSTPITITVQEITQLNKTKKLIFKIAIGGTAIAIIGLGAVFCPPAILPALGVMGTVYNAKTIADSSITLGKYALGKDGVTGQQALLASGQLAMSSASAIGVLPPFAGQVIGCVNTGISVANHTDALVEAKNKRERCCQAVNLGLDIVGGIGMLAAQNQQPQDPFQPENPLPEDPFQPYEGSKKPASIPAAPKTLCDTHPENCQLAEIPQFCPAPKYNPTGFKFEYTPSQPLMQYDARPENCQLSIRHGHGSYNFTRSHPRIHPYDSAYSRHTNTSSCDNPYYVDRAPQFCAAQTISNPSLAQNGTPSQPTPENAQPQQTWGQTIGNIVFAPVTLKNAIITPLRKKTVQGVKSGANAVYDFFATMGE